MVSLYRKPQENVSDEFDLILSAESNMCCLYFFDSLVNGRKVVVQPLFCEMMLPGFI